MPFEKLVEIHHNPDSLLSSWKYSIEQDGQASMDAVAASLEVTEAQLMAARVGSGVVRLRPDWAELFSALSQLGPVCATTGNSSVVLETIGTYPAISHLESYSSVVGERIDLRVSLPFWESAFAAVHRNSETNEIRRSLHFYGKDGAEAHRIDLTAQSSIDGFEEIVERFVHPVQSRTQFTDSVSNFALTVSPSEVDKRSFLKRWESLPDARSFFRLLSDFKLSRQDAFVLGESKFTQRLSPALLPQVLTSFLHQKSPLAILVGHSACVQVYRGALKRVTNLHNEITAGAVKVHGHFRQSKIATAWLVNKPTTAGPIRSLELFDKESRPVASIAAQELIQFFGSSFGGPMLAFPLHP